MVIKALMEIQKHGSGFMHHMDKFEGRMRQIWTALRFGHKRRKFFQRKLETIESIVKDIKSPNITITGSDQVTNNDSMFIDCCLYCLDILSIMVMVMVFNATFNNILAIWWWSPTQFYWWRKPK